MIIKQEEIDEAAKLKYPQRGIITDFAQTRQNDFKAGVEFAESKIEELAIEFGEYLIKLANNVIKKETALKPLDLSTGPILVRDLYQQFIKEL